MRAALLAVAVLAAPAAAHDFAAFGAVCDGITDDSQAWNAAMLAIARPSADRVLNLPAGACVMKSPPSPVPESASVVGQGLNTSILVRAYNGGGPFIWLRGQGGRLHSLSLYAAAGTSQGTGLYAESTDAEPGGGYSIADVWVTGAGTWSAPINFDGSPRTMAPLGIRDISMRNVAVFNATWHLMQCWSCIGLDWFGGGAYQGSGTRSGIVVAGPNAAANRVDAVIDWPASTIGPGAMR